MNTLPASPTNTFTMTGLVPAYGPWSEAKRIAVKLPASVTYSKGAVLGEVVGTNEVQSLALTTGGTLGGTYTLSFGGVVTSAIAFNASAATVQAALEAVSTIGVNNVAVTGTTPTTAGGTLTITFQNALGKQNVQALVPDATSLTGTTPGAAITTGTAGTGTANEVQTIIKTGTVTGGTFTITYSGQTTAAIAYDATPAAVQTALEALSNLGAGQIAVAGTANSVYILTFKGTLAGTDVAAVTVGSGSLTGGGNYGTVTVATAGSAGSNGTYKAFLSSATDGSQVAKAVLEFDAATDASGNITLGTSNLGGDKQQFSIGNTVTAFVSGTFRSEDCQQTAGAGQLTELAVSQLGRLVQGSVTQGLVRIG
jgi:hypothetical protein